MIVLALHPVAQKVVELLEPHLERHGFELVAIEYRPGTRNSLLRLLVDKPGGGVGLSDLEKLTPVVSDLLDVYDPIDGRYMLEIASPGVNRPLRKREHFEACKGERVRIKTHHAHDGQKAFLGRLLAVTDKGIEIDDASSHRQIAIDFDDMKEANYEYDFDQEKARG